MGIIVTADHGHTFQIGGLDSKRGTDIAVPTHAADDDQKNCTVSGYFTGPNNSGDNQFSSTLASSNAMSYASHSAEDVPIFARGPMAHLLTGVHEESYIGQVMKLASCVDQYADWKNDANKVKYASHCCSHKEMK